jgi:prolyl oligopeptidase
MCLADGIVAEVIDTLHGIEVADPFRWLEDRTLPETEAWIVQAKEKCDAYFDEIHEEYRALKEELRSRLDVEIVDQPVRIEDRYFFRRRNCGQERASIFVRDRNSGVERLLVEPDSQDHYVSIGIYRVSPDGAVMAFYKQLGGSDRRSVHFVDVASGRLLPIQLPYGYLRGLVFAPELDGFFFCQDTVRVEHSIRFLPLLEDQDEQVVFICERQGASKLSLIGDGNTLGATLIVERRGERDLDFWVARIASATVWTKVLAGADRSSFPLLYKDRLYFLRSESSPDASLVECDLKGNPQQAIVPKQAGSILQIAFVGDAVYVATQCGGRTFLHEWSLTSRDGRRIEEFENGTVRVASGSLCGESLFFTHEDYCRPPQLYEYSLPARHVTLWHQSDAQAFPALVLHQSACASDGASIPVTLIERKDSLSRAALVTPYGSFGTAVLPQYSAFMSLMVDRGFTLAIPHVRGGGEGGPEWHEAGRRRNKLTSIDDLICVVKQLPSFSEIDPEKVALYGTSGGALLVAAAAMRAPTLFRAIVSIGPLLDMLRYDKFGRARRWIEEFGTSEIEEDFNVLHSYSPYHNIPRGETLPAFLFVTGDEDDRCDPAHVRKMAARLEEGPKLSRPVIVEYGRHRGHAPGLPVEDRVESLAKRCAFLRRELDLPQFHGGLQ